MHQNVDTAPKGQTRTADLRRMLEERRQVLMEDLQQRVRQRTIVSAAEVGDTADLAEADVQDELDFALMQMKTEMLEQVHRALTRLETGDYGICVECFEEITEQRLRAMPFALRCTSCENIRESRVRRPASTPMFSGAGFDLR